MDTPPDESAAATHCTHILHWFTTTHSYQEEDVTHSAASSESLGRLTTSVTFIMPQRSLLLFSADMTVLNSFEHRTGGEREGRGAQLQHSYSTVTAEHTRQLNNWRWHCP